MLRVVKLGGSLLELADVVPRLRYWLSENAALRTLLVVGGGKRADAVRRQQLPDVAAHAQAIESMRKNARDIAISLTGGDLLAKPATARGDLPRGLQIVDPVAWLEGGSPSLRPLPASWDVTSDSIAAWVAERVAADELVLLKSCLPEDASLAALVASGYVDPYFARAAKASRPIRLVNLREPDFTEHPSRGGSAYRFSSRLVAD